MVARLVAVCSFCLRCRGMLSICCRRHPARRSLGLVNQFTNVVSRLCPVHDGAPPSTNILAPVGKSSCTTSSLMAVRARYRPPAQPPPKGWRFAAGCAPQAAEHVGGPLTSGTVTRPERLPRVVRPWPGWPSPPHPEGRRLSVAVLRSPLRPGPTGQAPTSPGAPTGAVQEISPHLVGQALRMPNTTGCSSRAPSQQGPPP